MAEIRHLENRDDVIFFCRGWSDLDKISETGAEWHVDCGDVEFQYGGRLGDFDGMSSQSQCHTAGVLPLGKFMITIPEPHATLQSVRIPSAILKIVIRHIIRKVGCGFIFAFHSNYGSVLHHFRDKEIVVENRDFYRASAHWYSNSVRLPVCLSVRPSVLTSCHSFFTIR